MSIGLTKLHGQGSMFYTRILISIWYLNIAETEIHVHTLGLDLECVKAGLSQRIILFDQVVTSIFSGLVQRISHLA